MELSAFAFWILFSLILFAIFLMITIFLFSQMQKKRVERRLDEVFFEVRELNLRVTIVETRMEERIPVHSFPKVSHSLIGVSNTVAKKRGRPRKDSEE